MLVCASDIYMPYFEVLTELSMIVYSYYRLMAPWGSQSQLIYVEIIFSMSDISNLPFIYKEASVSIVKSFYYAPSGIVCSGREENQSFKSV